mgnify:CR=1 FL=1
MDIDNRYIMTAFGRDRVGIVADITEVLHELGCNFEDGNMTRLSDEFVLIFLFTHPDEIDDDLSAACEHLEKDKGISAFFRMLGSEAMTPDLSLPRHTLHLEGMDQTGIVYKFSRLLADQGVNILYLQSERRNMPQTGTSMYIVDMDIEIPLETGIDSLRSAVQALGEEADVSVKLS